jgi:DNA-binding transcriptional MerR regulator
VVVEPGSPLSAGDRRLPIGVFARLTQLTRKALKTYERYGFLRPAHIDPQTHYRYYSLQQVRTAETIRLLRSVGVPLRDVAAALRADEATPLPVLLARRRLHLAEELAATDRLLDHLESVNGDPSRGLSTKIAVRDVAAHVDLVCAAQCTHETHEATVDRLLDRLARLLDARRLEPLGRETATYFADFDLTHDYRVEVSARVDLPCDEGETLPPPCRHTPPATVATAVHRGPYGEMYTTSACLIAWVAEHDLPLTGRFSETYLVDERDTDDADAFRTLIGLGIATTP